MCLVDLPYFSGFAQCLKSVMKWTSESVYKVNINREFWMVRVPPDKESWSTRIN